MAGGKSRRGSILQGSVLLDRTIKKAQCYGLVSGAEGNHQRVTQYLRAKDKEESKSPLSYMGGVSEQ